MHWSSGVLVSDTALRTLCTPCAARCDLSVLLGPPCRPPGHGALWEAPPEPHPHSSHHTWVALGSSVSRLDVLVRVRGTVILGTWEPVWGCK